MIPTLQILEMDDDEDEREFSKSIVYDFFQQARTTFQTMNTKLYVGYDWSCREGCTDVD